MPYNDEKVQNKNNLPRLRIYLADFPRKIWPFQQDDTSRALRTLLELELPRRLAPDLPSSRIWAHVKNDLIVNKN